MTQETEYSTDPAHISQNLVHLASKTKIYPANQPELARVKRVEYTPQGNPYRVYEGESATGILLKEFAYDGLGRLIVETVPGPKGPISSRIEYSEGSVYGVTITQGGKVSRKELSVNTGQVLKEVGPNGETTRYQYDEYGRPTIVTYPDGRQKTVAYSSDLKTTTVTAGGVTVRQKIDGLGRLKWIDNPAGEDDTAYSYYFGSEVSAVTVGQLTGDTVTGRVAKSYTYDTKLRIKTLTTDFGTTTTTYDDINRKVRVTDPAGRYSETRSNELGWKTSTYRSADNSTITYTYNGFGELLRTVDPRGLIHQQDLDKDGRLVRGYHTARTEGTLAVKQTPTYLSGLPGVVDYVSIQDTNGQSHRTYQYIYDSDGRMGGMKLGGTMVEELFYDMPSQQYGKGKV
ncbi:hypothetical protein EBR96_07325, partial [bacterium]|nr:hypothetical protein [bacterium]